MSMKLDKDQMLCDKCGLVISEYDDHTTTDDGNTYCPDCSQSKKESPAWKCPTCPEKDISKQSKIAFNYVPFCITCANKVAPEDPIKE